MKQLPNEQLPLNFVRVHNRHLSFWQSVVSEYAGNELTAANVKVSQNVLLKHPMVRATSAHVSATADGTPPDTGRLNLADPHQLNVYLSHLGFQQALCLADGDTERANEIGITYRKFSDKDLGFLTCASTYAKYLIKYKGRFAYNDWMALGEDLHTYSVIGDNNNGNGYTLPDDARVAIIGDWGTGLADAEALLLDIMLNHDPAAIIHLGDIYYSGTPEESINNFAQIFSNVFNDKRINKTVPVFTIPGNHDYYALGWGYYDMVSKLNTAIGSAALQPASYFCLRTEDQGWQLLAMDTGYNDSNPGDQADTTYSGPWLQPNEITWHLDKLNNFDGATILLSHHQLFSANGKINGSYSKYGNLPYLNPYLYEVFRPYFANNIAAWLWGHEHNFVMYENDLLGLSKGRLIGCSAYEELESADPYKINYPEIRYFINPQTGRPVQLGVNADPNGVKYYNHGYAVIDLGGRHKPTDPVTATYYEFPSWGDHKPLNPAASALYQEQYAKPDAAKQPQVPYKTDVNIFSQEGLYVAPIYNNIYNYPTLSIDQPVNIQLIPAGGGATINSGDVVYIRTEEPVAGSKNLLGAWSTPTLYYYDGEHDQLLWTVYKKDTGNGKEIHYGDEVYFINNYHHQWLVPYWSKVYNGTYLTTKKDADYYWQILKK